MKEIKNALTIIVCSCDKYDDLWYPYFEIFKNQWKDCKYPIILNTESKTYTHDGLTIKCLNLYNRGEDVPWSDRMIETLKYVDTEYVLITLDDHFLISPVDSEKFEGAFDIIKKHKRISALSFLAFVPANEKTKWRGNFGLWKMNKYFRINLDTAIWRKKALLRNLRKGENAWEFELNATERALWDFTEYYRYKQGAEPILDISFHLRRGYGLIRGKWCWRNPELFEQFNIPMDFSKRGYMDKAECIGYVEKENAQNAEFDKKVMHKDNKFKAFLVQAKRRIPVKFRIFLSKIKRFFIGYNTEDKEKQ